MLKAAFLFTSLAVSTLFAGSAAAGRSQMDAFMLERIMPKAHKQMSSMKPKLRKVAASQQCEGETKPVIACECLSQDSNGVCIQETCDTVCEGKGD
jgi:hypothetical protein